MAAAEARAAWQRAANRCMVQEDRKRAPKLACCPLSSEQHGTNNGNSTTSEGRPISNFVPLSCNPINSNLPQDIRWRFQLQPNFRVQKDLASEQRCFLGREIGEKEVEDSGPMSKHEEPLLRGTVINNPEKGEDVFEPPSMNSTDFVKHSSETGSEERKTIVGYSQVPLKCRGNVSISDCLCDDKKFQDFRSSCPPPLKNQQKVNSNIDVSWKEGEKAQPWWQITDENELASLVAEKAMQHIENCDLPRPAQVVRVHGTEYNQENMGEYEGSSCSAVWQEQKRNNTYSGAQVFSRSNHTAPESKQMPLNPSERAQLLEALRHSQTRAREAEMAAKEAHSDKDDAITLLLQQASHLFACKQWLKLLQLENICLQLKHKRNRHQIAALMKELPWLSLNEKPAPKEERKDWTGRKGRRRQKKRGCFCDAILFAFGLGLAGAGLLLGWTLGWLLPKL
ncbi:hypothetical protein BRADI_3g35320v3 [Brachypodium distachyon]|uniref:Uncharacterized protein n=1 Tax=Brachypodium distachyon TaxID=15368 RepID=A0A0Q3FGC3_BRADI|nr:hypothetical protein BRADI_3g35320v3 [Brachypodium distachyon]KQJ98182.1 hypothetical protein BRADI_3g35320v3 [Brachypodium distachyon]KQJ98184.1 hypothetical protein BRADI_3g35320v3 [Brachypodium distachyon]